MAYDPPDYDGHKDSLTYYAIWDSSYLKDKDIWMQIAATTTST
jgi:hypothetical protein